MAEDVKSEWFRRILTHRVIWRQKIKPSEITPESVYLNRRNFIRAGLDRGNDCGDCLDVPVLQSRRAVAEQRGQPSNEATSQTRYYVATDDKLNSFEDITNYNNFYEFSTDKRAVRTKGGGVRYAAVDGRSRRPCPKTATFGDRRAPQVRSGRTDLSLPLRRGVVDGDSLDGISAEDASRSS